MMAKCKKGFKKVDGECKKSSGKSTKNLFWKIFAVIGFIALVAIIIFLIFKFPSFGQVLSVTDTTIIGRLNNPTNPPEVSCSLSLTPNIINSGESTTGIINGESNVMCVVYARPIDGDWAIVFEGMTDQFGGLSQTETIFIEGDFEFRAICGSCITNGANLKVNPEPVVSNCIDSDGENPNTFGHVELADEGIGIPDECHDGDTVREQICVGDGAATKLIDCSSGRVCSSGRCVEGLGLGDNVGSGTSGSGDANFGDDFITSPIILDWTTGGPFILGARITRSWDYKDPNCMSFPEQFPMEWTFWDTNRLAWQELDYVPVNNVVAEVCPVTYHEDVPWQFSVSVGIQSCQVEYSWNLQPFICGEV